MCLRKDARTSDDFAMIYMSTLFFSLFITITLIPIFRRLAVRLNAMDIPDTRKVHTFPMPKTGGIAMALGCFIPVLLWVPKDLLLRSVLIGAGILVIFGFIDDLKGISYKLKFTGQIVASLIVILYGGLRIESLGMLLPGDMVLPGWLAALLTLFVIVGVTNAINLSDGLDGLAGGVSILSFICIACLGCRVGEQVIALVAVAAIGAIFGFLRYNTYPAKLFMGDIGSQLLGFVAVTLSVGLTQKNAPLSPLLPLLLLGFPVLDTLTVITERLKEGRSPFIADKNHFHHKLLRLGLFHTETVLVIYVLQTFLVLSAFVFRYYSEWFLLIFYITFSGVIVTGFYIADRTGWKLKRFDFVDSVIKGRLRVLKEKAILIRVSFKGVKLGMPLLFLFTCFLPSSIPGIFSFSAIGFMVLLILTYLTNRQWVGGLLRLTMYLSIPCLIYLTDTDMAGWVGGRLNLLYNFSFGILVLLVISTLKFTRRENGFKISPMHFIILFIALFVPNLPGEYFENQHMGQHIGQHMGLIAVKIITLFFSFDVLLEELREKTNRLAVLTGVALAVIGVRGFL